MAVLVVGSVALDTVETPFGKVTDALGGSAVYFALAASLYTPVALVGVVGEDFPARYLEWLRQRPIDLRGLQVRPGRTFRWAGWYDYDLNHAHTLETHLNVFADFQPDLPADYRRARFVFLANIDPDLQLRVLDQVERPELVVVDSMNYWIAHKRAALTRVLERADIVTLNEAEVREYAQHPVLLTAARRILALGPRALVVKKGEYGCVLFANDHYFVAPAYPLEEVRDPTGAGDSFAGGMLGYLATCPRVTMAALRRALVHGSVVASFTCEAFSVERLLTLDRAAIAARYREFREFTSFETGEENGD